MTVDILVGDCRDILPTLPENHFHAVVTSPPYWKLRDYGHPDQLGLETEPSEYLRNLVGIFRAIKSTLRDDGTLWLNMGDSYVTGTNAPHKGGARGSSQNTQDAQNAVPRNGYPFELRPKNLIMMPARLAIALQEDGWILRSDIIWEKPNPMPESVYDRPTTAHEHLFLFSKQDRYYYDFEAMKEPVTESSLRRMAQDIENQAGSTRANGNSRPDRPMKTVGGKTLMRTPRSRAPRGWDTSPDGDHRSLVGNHPEHKNNDSFSSAVVDLVHSRNRRTVWRIPTAPFKEAHFATFPPALVEPCLIAGTNARACEKCGRPWVTIAIEKVETGGRESGNLERQYRVDHGGNPDLTNAHQGFGFPWTPTSTITERRQSCKCEGAEGSGRCRVLDPFAGAGTVGLVASRMARDATLIELKPEYAAIAERRIFDDAPLFR